MPKQGRRERLELLLQSENEKSLLQNKAQLGKDGFGPSKYRALKLSATDAASGNVQVPKPSRGRRGMESYQDYVDRPISNPNQGNEYGYEAQAAPTQSIPNSPGEWKVLRMFEQELNEVDQMARKQMGQLAVQQQQEALHRQRMEKQAERMAQRDQVEKEAQLIKQDLARWSAVEKKKKDDIKARDMQIKVERQMQMAENKAAREAEKAKMFAQDQRQIAELRGQMDADMENERVRKLQDKERMLEELKAHKELMAAKEQAKADEKEADRIATAAYAQYLEAQDDQREANLKKMYGKAQERSSTVDGSHPTTVAKKAAETKRLGKVLKDKEKEFAAKEALNAKVKAAKKEEQLSLLGTQMEARQRQAQEVAKDKAALAEMVKERDAMELQRDAEAANLRRHRALQHRQELEAQIAANRAKKESSDEDAMTAAEAKYNALLLDRARTVLEV